VDLGACAGKLAAPESFSFGNKSVSFIPSAFDMAFRALGQGSIFSFSKLLNVLAAIPILQASFV